MLFLGIRGYQTPQLYEYFIRKGVLVTNSPQALKSGCQDSYHNKLAMGHFFGTPCRFGYYCGEYCFTNCPRPEEKKREEQLSDLHSSRLLLREPSEDKAGQGTNQGWHAVG